MADPDAARRITLAVGHTVATEKAGKRWQVYARYIAADGGQRRILTSAPPRGLTRDKNEERAASAADASGLNGGAADGGGRSCSGDAAASAKLGQSGVDLTRTPPPLVGPSHSAPDLTAVRGVSFRIVSDDSRVTETFIASPGPFEWGKLSGFGGEACVPIAVTFHFSDPSASPHIHVHDVFLDPHRSAAARRSGVLRPPPPADEVELLLPVKKAFRWGAHEAAPGHYLAGPAPLSEQGARIGSAWAGRAVAAPAGRPPQPTDFNAFPPLGGERLSGFVMGRTHSFSSAIRLSSPRPSSDGDGGGSSVSNGQQQPIRHVASLGAFPASFSREIGTPRPISRSTFSEGASRRSSCDSLLEQPGQPAPAPPPQPVRRAATNSCATANTTAANSNSAGWTNRSRSGRPPPSPPVPPPPPPVRAPSPTANYTTSAGAASSLSGAGALSGGGVLTGSVAISAGSAPQGCSGYSTPPHCNGPPRVCSPLARTCSCSDDLSFAGAAAAGTTSFADAASPSVVSSSGVSGVVGGCGATTGVAAAPAALAAMAAAMRGVEEGDGAENGSYNRPMSTPRATRRASAAADLDENSTEGGLSQGSPGGVLSRESSGGAGQEGAFDYVALAQADSRAV